MLKKHVIHRVDNARYTVSISPATPQTWLQAAITNGTRGPRPLRRLCRRRWESEMDVGAGATHPIIPNQLTRQANHVYTKESSKEKGPFLTSGR